MKSLAIITLITILATVAQCRRVRVGVYYETECNGCRNEILNNLAPAVEAIGQYMELELVPWGNARVSNNRIYCQHGDSECVGNAMHACVLDLYQFQTAYQFILCTFDSADYYNPPVAARQCAQRLNMNFDQISSCANSQQGYELSMEMGRRTPRHNYVPWTLIEGEGPIEGDIKEYICQRYLSDVDACRY